MFVILKLPSVARLILLFVKIDWYFKILLNFEGIVVVNLENIMKI